MTVRKKRVAPRSQSKLKSLRAVSETKRPPSPRGSKAASAGVKTSALAEAKFDEFPRVGEGSGRYREFGGSEHPSSNQTMMADVLTTRAMGIDQPRTHQ